MVKQNFLSARPHFVRDLLNYVSMTEAEWRKLTTPFQRISATAAEEREALRQFVIGFEKWVVPDDIRGDTGNLFPQRGQQDCVEEAATLFAPLYLLSANHYFQFHWFNLERPMYGIPFVHHTAVIQERVGGCQLFAVDPWDFFTTVEPLRKWEEGYMAKLKEDRGPKF